MAFSFGANRKEAEKQGLLSSGDYLKLKEGGNRLRLLSPCLAHNGEYQGRKNFKWLCYVLDRTDGKPKPFFMPHTIYKQIEALQMSEDYAFADVPMPYDITINADGAGTKEVKYTLMPARKESRLTEGEIEAFEALKPIDELKAALDEKTAKGKPQGDPERDQHHDDAPPHTDEDFG